MAALNEILGVASRLQQLLTRKFVITGGSPSPQLTPEITPVHEMSNVAIEDRWLMRERMWAFTQAIGATALTRAEALLTNPADSGILVIARAMIIARGNPSAFTVFTGTFAALGTNVGGITSNLDTRQQGSITTKSTATFSYDNLGAAGFTTGSELPTLLIHTPYISPFEYVLSPGYSLFIGDSNINNADTLGFVWRERPASLGELQL